MKIYNKLKFHRFMLILIIITMTINIMALNVQLAEARQHKQIVFITKPIDEQQRQKQFLEKANKEMKEIQRLNKISLNFKQT